MPFKGDNDHNWTTSFQVWIEIIIFLSWCLDVIGMTMVSDAIFAKEAVINDAKIVMATNYNCWYEHEESVLVDGGLRTWK